MPLTISGGFGRGMSPFASTGSSKVSPLEASSAVADLGFGGQQLQEQVAGETEEMRKKRMQQMQQRMPTGFEGILGGVFGGGGLGGFGDKSAANLSLFGSGG